MNDKATAPMSGRSQPDRAAVLRDRRLAVIQNALATAMMSRVRDARTGAAEFERLASELAGLALWTACRDLALVESTVPGFAANQIRAHELTERIAGVVILRAGLVFTSPFRRLLPDAPLHQVGVRRDERTLAASVYTHNLPNRKAWADRVLILDPMLATGGSAVSTIALVRSSHEGPIDVVSLIAAPVGVATVLAVDAGCRVHTVALDDRLDERGYIEPGLGDAGDRAFGTLQY
ncbi:MAG TPA: uracil phosphoribosyltransferase [Thermomicrobiales bacterium]|nr:uracil phosphoribosyltransferase [Thermomicrobiales bacterium]